MACERKLAGHFFALCDRAWISAANRTICERIDLGQGIRFRRPCIVPGQCDVGAPAQVLFINTLTQAALFVPITVMLELEWVRGCRPFNC